MCYKSSHFCFFNHIPVPHILSITVFKDFTGNGRCVAGVAHHVQISDLPSTPLAMEITGS
jgi:hypothetical protein